jgi:hypothetical protein
MWARGADASREHTDRLWNGKPRGYNRTMLVMEFAFIGLSAIWCLLAIHYSDPSAGSDRRIRRKTALAACVAIPALSIVFLPSGTATVISAAILAVTLIWFVRLSPHDRGDWETEYARMPEVEEDGNLIKVKGVRDFRYRSVEDVIPAYYDDAYDTDSVTSIDLICSYWSGRAIAHVFLSFGFADGRHVAISVETRRRRGQPYSTIAGFFRHYQLIFVVADERDLIGVRTDIRREEVYLYQLRTTADERRRLFRGYMERAAKLAREPEFYNTVFNNCTSNIVSLIDGGLPRGERLGMSWRLLFSGYADEFAYDIGRLKSRTTFAELKRRSLVVRQANAVIGADFSAAIRSGSPALPSAMSATPSARSG